MTTSTYRQHDVTVRVKEYENGEPYLLIEQKVLPGESAPEDLKPFAFDLKLGTSCAEADTLAQTMRCLITHVHYE